MPSAFMDFIDDFNSAPHPEKATHFDSAKDAAHLSENCESSPRPDDVDDDGNTSLTSQALNPDGTPRRPMNAFMIFARRRRPQLSAENQSMRTGEVSKILSKEWNTMAPSDKQFYLDQAKILKDNFNAKYPDYVYRRRPNNSRRRRRSDSEGHTVDGGSGPSDDGSESSPVDGIDRPRSRDSHSPLDRGLSASVSHRSLPYPGLSGAPGSYRRHTDVFPPLGGSSAARESSRPSWQDSSWSSSGKGLGSFGFQTQQAPFYPTSTTSSHYQPRLTSSSSYSSISGRGFNDLDLGAPRLSTSRSQSGSPFDYLSDFSSSSYHGSDPFSNHRVSPDLPSAPQSLPHYTHLPPLHKSNSLHFSASSDRLF